MSENEVRIFVCQQCKYEQALDTVFNFEVCPQCGGNFFLKDYTPPIDWQARAETAETDKKRLKIYIGKLEAKIPGLNVDLAQASLRAETAESKLTEWQAVARLLADELAEANSQRFPVCWEDASESSPAWIAFCNLRDRSEK